MVVACEKDINFSVFHFISKNPSRPAESTSSLKKVSIISAILLMLLASFETQFVVVIVFLDIPTRVRRLITTHASNSNQAWVSLFQTYMSKRSSDALAYRYGVRVYVVLKGSNHAEIDVLAVQWVTVVQPCLLSVDKKS